MWEGEMGARRITLLDIMKELFEGELGRGCFGCRRLHLAAPERWGQRAL